MLSNRTAAKPSKFMIPVVDDEGNDIEASAARWALFDERGASIAASAVTNYAGDSTLEFTIGGEHLEIEGTTAGRELVIYLTTAGGEVELRDYFLVVASSPIALMTNSFITYPEALSVRQTLGATLEGWDAASRVQQASAMVDAYEHLLRMVYRVSGLAGRQSTDYAGYGEGDDVFEINRRVRLRGITLSEFDALPESFRRAIKRAQIIEANSILGGDKVERKRQEGVISETVGESSIFLQSKPYLNLPISRAAYEELKRFIVLTVGVARG